MFSKSLIALAIIAGFITSAHAASPMIERGGYLVHFGGCGDCHTPGYFLGKPDESRALSGSDVGFSIPGLGVFVGRNLTPDKETGLGNWTTAQIVAAITKGQRPDGRVLAPIMPWRDFATLTHRDATAIALYLKSLKPISHAVAGPFGPNDKVTTFVNTVVPADAFNAMPKPPAGPPPGK